MVVVNIPLTWKGGLVPPFILGNRQQLTVYR